ncbi:hypothetical protein DPMN_015147 [Dreissena polymorpha]|uniref:Uncharacterized protein n=1 Tax=Dreissena polymorpha TaxID=45954 RepID=A0A9D4NB13_DREPO|nr:hypothetical protein DPMN_015147 [Dreissena polymorpha]
MNYRIAKVCSKTPSPEIGEFERTSGLGISFNSISLSACTLCLIRMPNEHILQNAFHIPDNDLVG